MGPGSSRPRLPWLAACSSDDRNSMAGSTTSAAATGGEHNHDDAGPARPPGQADANGLQLPAGFTSRIIATPARSWPAPATPGTAPPTAAPASRRRRRLDLRLELRGRPAARRWSASTADGAIVGAGRILDGTDRQLRRRRHAVGHVALVRGVTAARCASATPPARPGRRPAGHGPLQARGRRGRPRSEVTSTSPRTSPTARSTGSCPTAWRDLDAGHARGADRAPRATVAGCGARPAGALRSRPATRSPSTKRFNGGEGIWPLQGRLPVTTKGDNRVWALRLGPEPHGRLRRGHARRRRPCSPASTTSRVDAGGDRYVAEDGGDMEIVGLQFDGTITRSCRLTGVDRLGDHRPGVQPRRQPPLLQLAAQPGPHLRDQRALPPHGDQRRAQPPAVVSGTSPDSTTVVVVPVVVVGACHVVEVDVELPRRRRAPGSAPGPRRRPGPSGWVTAAQEELLVGPPPPQAHSRSLSGGWARKAYQPSATSVPRCWRIRSRGSFDPDTSP